MAGGEDVVFEAERALLQAHGHAVVTHTDHNDRVDSMGRLRLALETIWSRRSCRLIDGLLRDRRPDLAHFHNTFVLVSPAAYRACRRRGVPVVQTLHNYRLLCPAATFLRQGAVCQECLGRTPPWPAVRHGCYHDSAAASGVVAAMLWFHRKIRTFQDSVTLFIALTEFARAKFIEGGLPAEKIVVKSNFVHPDPGPGDGAGGHALFVGRLSQEKGIGVLLEAWRRLDGRIPLRIVGDGPLGPVVRGATRSLQAVEWLGYLPPAQVTSLMRSAAMLVLPSTWFENMPMTLLEAYSTGLPVVASDLGALSSLVDSGRTGRLFRAGDPEHLATVVEELFSRPRDLQAMRAGARAEFEARYTAEAGYRQLRAVYDRALQEARGSRRGAS